MIRPVFRLPFPVSLGVSLAGAVLSLLVAAPPDAPAAPRSGNPMSHPAAPNTFDSERRFDANDLDLWTTNYGSLAFDVPTANPGLEFPRGSSKFVVFAAGLWVGAQVAGEKRVTLAEYSQEWGPGRILGGAPEDPFGPGLRSWKVVPVGGFSTPPDSEFLVSGTGDPVAHEAWSQYVAQAGPTGAPVDGVGPNLPGQLALWAVFNDADPNLHFNDAGQTAPLGLEVKQEVFGFRADLPGVAFVRWTLEHRGSSPLDSAYVGFWCDPDLGTFTDDLVGWSGFHALGYAYNGQAVDGVYGSAPPATGVQYLGGPAGIPLAAFSPYGNGEDPNSAVQSYRLLQGLDRSGNEYVDPTSSLPSRFPYSGDPGAGLGWLDPTPRDRRFMVSVGPFRFTPGEAATFTFALLAAQGKDRFDSIERLECVATAARNAYKQDYIRPFPPLGPECDVAVPVALSLEEATCSEGVVRLAWYVAGENAGPFDLARRSDGSEAWSPLGSVSVDGTRRVRYEDRSVVAGERWIYGLFDPRRPDVPLDQVVVNVPGAPATALALSVSSGAGAGSVDAR